jgi:hypothetical protein
MAHAYQTKMGALFRSSLQTHEIYHIFSLSDSPGFSNLGHSGVQLFKKTVTLSYLRARIILGIEKEVLGKLWGPLEAGSLIAT